MNRRAGYALLLAALASGFVWFVWRYLGHGWGATNGEARAALPGDEVVPQPVVQTTHAVTIKAPAAAVWPWLIQMGYGRAGWYTNVWWYRLVDRYIWGVDMPRADRLLPQFQRLALGDVIPDGPPGAAYWTVVGLEPERSLALYSITHGTVWLPSAVRDNPRLGIRAEVSWVFVLREPAPGQTRLILRTRATAGPALYRLLATEFLPPSDYVMARMLLSTIKRNVERTSARQGQPSDAVSPAPLSGVIR